MADDHYTALEVPRDASPEVIKDAWRRIAKASHPDRNPGDEAAVARFLRASEAYEVLGDPSRRARYDRSLRAPRRDRVDEDIVWAPQGVQRRGGGRRAVHAPPPSDRDVQAVRSGTRSDGSVLMVIFGAVGGGPVALIFTLVAATIAGPLPFLVLAGGLAGYALFRLRGHAETQASALVVALLLVFGAAFAAAQEAGLLEAP